MVISLDEWSDFPRGLRIMILDEDSHFASQTKSTLESFHYIVSTFNQESDALDALEQDNESFHVALVDATTGSGGVKFLEAKPDMPTVMMSSKTCLNTMMKCIALGAVEFLQKPVVEDKLKNIWQHVVHKAFSGGEQTVANSLKPVKASIMSLLDLMSTSNKSEMEEKNVEEVLDDKKECIERSNSEKFAAPSTPQIQGGRSSPTKLNNSQDVSISSVGNKVSEAPTIDNSKLDNVFSPDNSFQSVRREIDENDKPSSRITTSFSHMQLLQSVDNTCDLFVNAFSSSSTSFHHPKAEEEVSSVVGSQNTIVNVDTSIDDKKKKTSSKSSNKRSNPSSGSKKKLKIQVEWTPELHKRFVQAVEQLGVDQAIPSKILDIMKVDGLTRHNIASHLQKYRANRRHIKMREDEVARGRSWSHWTNNHHKAKLAPGYQQPVQPASLHVWGCPASEYLNARHHPIWQQQVQVGTPATWPSHTWNQPMGYTEAWSCPTPTYGAPQYHHSMLKPYSSSSSYLAQNSNQTVSFMDSAKHILNKPVEDHPAAEETEKAIKEALKNPWSALPLGLKPPSMESVIAELQRQGIKKIPPMTK